MKQRDAAPFLAPLLAAWALASPAFAQEIVVTGERRAVEASDVASSVARLSADDLAGIGAQAPSEALNRLAGVAIHRNNGVENLPAIRSPVLTGGQSAGSFLVLEDGVPIRAPGFGNVNQLYETMLPLAAGVEVTRGPGTALYGSNAVHGLVNVLTPQPGVRARRGGADLSLGSFERVAGAAWGAFGTREGAVDDTHLLYVGAAASHEGGWRDDAGVDQQSALFGWDAYAGAWNIEARLAVQNLNQETASFIEGVNAYENRTLARSNPTPEAFRDQQLARARVTISREAGDWRFVATPYARWIDSALLLSFFPSRALELTGQEGGGVQAAAYWNDPGSAVTAIFGADGDWTRGDVYEFQARATQPAGYVQGLHYDYSVDMEALALYAQIAWRLAPSWLVQAGLRGERVTYAYDNHAPSGDFGRFRRAADRDDSFEEITPKFAVLWRPDNASTVWLNLARGARPPQIVDLYSLQTTQTPGGQRAETIDSAELGWRGVLGAGRFEVALYAMDKQDTSFRNADGFTVTNGRTRHEGIEAQAEFPVLERLTLAGWVTYARHTYRFNDSVTRAGESIVSGDDVDGAPRWVWNGRATWEVRENASLELEWVHMGEYFTNAANTRTYPGHDVFNLRGEWRATGDVTFYAALRNVGDVDYAERADFAFGNDRYFPGEGRALTVGLRAAR